jgi:uncharacterized membrane protein HdeD (DUF308 family)
MSTIQLGVDPVRLSVTRSLQEHWRLFLFEGIVLLVLGLAAILVPPVATIAVEILLGWLLLVSGILGLLTTWRMRKAPGLSWALLSAVLAIVAGLVLLRWPLSGAISLTLILTIFFFVEGIASIFYALDHRRELSGRWNWMLVSGAIDLILASFIFIGLPGTAAWAIGLLVGINMIFGGAAVIAMALHARTPLADT